MVHARVPRAVETWLAAVTPMWGSWALQGTAVVPKVPTVQALRPLWGCGPTSPEGPWWLDDGPEAAVARAE